MTTEQVAIWAMVGAWVNAVAMGAAAVFAGFAWRAQTRVAREERERHRRIEAVEAARAAVADLTTGEVERARDSVASWVSAFAGSVPPTTSVGEEPRRGNLLVGTLADAETRRDVFILLWSLQRLAPLAEMLDHAMASQREILKVQIGLIADLVGDLGQLLDPIESAIFRESAAAASGAVVAVASGLSAEVDLALDWSTDLSVFSRVVVEG